MRSRMRTFVGQVHSPFSKDDTLPFSGGALHNLANSSGSHGPVGRHGSAKHCAASRERTPPRIWVRGVTTVRTHLCRTAAAGETMTNRRRAWLALALCITVGAGAATVTVCNVFLRQWRRSNRRRNKTVSDLFPKPSKYFSPLVNDSTVTDNIPNVVYGCANTTRQMDGVELHVMGWSRAASLQALLGQLDEANYNGWTRDIPLYIHIDGNPGDASDDVNSETAAVANQHQWAHGPVTVHVQPHNVGLRSMWLDVALGPAARRAGSNTLLVALEDDVRVSKDYFQWLIHMIDAYGRNPTCRDVNLMGYSLSPIVLEEMTKPFTKWDAQEAVGSRGNNSNRHLTYLSVVPSSWGAAYWSDRWNDFDKFVHVRMEAPFYNASAEEDLQNVKDYGELQLSPPVLHVPGARSNVWPKSWKRFMIDFMYGRGLVMVYPNLPGHEGLATALQESGEHVSSIGKKKFRNPRVVDLLARLDLPLLGRIPRYGDMAVFGLTLQPVTRVRLVVDGVKLLNEVWQNCVECRRLVQVWNRPGIDIPDMDLKDTVPQICAADVYTSVSMAASRPVSSRTNERFLLYEPQYGANNQLHAVIEAFYWARALNRRLVVPPIFMPRVSESSGYNDLEHRSNLHDFFEIRDPLQPSLFKRSEVDFDHGTLEPVRFPDLSKQKVQPWRILRITRQAIFDVSSRSLTATFENSDLPLVHLRHLFENKMPIEKVTHLLGGCEDEVLALDGLFFAELQGLNPRNLMPDVLQATHLFKTVYDIVKKKFVSEMGTTKYGCYHVRLGDFDAMCDLLDQPESAAIEIPSFYVKTAAEFACHVKPTDLTTMLTEKGNAAFIMSDNPQKLSEAIKELSLKTITSQWVAQAIKDTIQSEVSHSDIQVFGLLIDQQLCADAKYAVLSRFSTVSQRVISLRRGRSYEYWMRETEEDIVPNDIIS